MSLYVYSYNPTKNVTKYVKSYDKLDDAKQATIDLNESKMPGLALESTTRPTDFTALLYVNKNYANKHPNIKLTIAPPYLPAYHSKQETQFISATATEWLLSCQMQKLTGQRIIIQETNSRLADKLKELLRGSDQALWTKRTYFRHTFNYPAFDKYREESPKCLCRSNTEIFQIKTYNSTNHYYHNNGLLAFMPLKDGTFSPNDVTPLIKNVLATHDSKTIRRVALTKFLTFENDNHSYCLLRLEEEKKEVAC